LGDPRGLGCDGGAQFAALDLKCGRFGGRGLGRQRQGAELGVEAQQVRALLAQLGFEPATGGVNDGSGRRKFGGAVFDNTIQTKVSRIYLRKFSCVQRSVIRAAATGKVLVMVAAEVRGTAIGRIRLKVMCVIH
jgi:hypothetical protein